VPEIGNRKGDQMARNKWVAFPRTTAEEMDLAMAEFQSRGGEVIAIPDNFKPEKKLNDTAVKIGKVYRQLDATKSKG
jgi:hypothetical protein